MITFCVVNQKGGTAKTTTAVTMAHALALEGRRTLIVDTDPQGHVAVALGKDKAPGIRALIEQPHNLPLVQARPNLWMLPSDKSTEQAKCILTGMPFRETILRRALANLDFDVTVIDCAPSLDVLHLAAMIAANWMIIPTRLDFLAVDGVNEVLRTLTTVRQAGTAPRVLGILPTFLDRQTSETVVQLRTLASAFVSLVLPPIPVDTKLREAPAHGLTIWEYAPTSRSVVGTQTGNGRKVGGYLEFMARVRRVLK
jgi:chromosome partitioning protein